jgi:NAD dependent epimerase/dehydratase family enzyme
MAQALLLDGVRVNPRELGASGFPFRFPVLETALRDELGLLPHG